MNTQTTVPTLRQRQALAAYNDARRELITAAEREFILREFADRQAPEPTFWQQIMQECADAPLHMQVGVAVFFGAGVGVTVALICGWMA